MGHQIIKTPDGQLAVFSSVVDDWIITNATPEDLLDYYAEKAAKEAREATQRVLDFVLADDPRGAYFQFAMTFDKAQEVRASVHGAAPWPVGGEGDHAE